MTTLIKSAFNFITSSILASKQSKKIQALLKENRDLTLWSDDKHRMVRRGDEVILQKKLGNVFKKKAWFTATGKNNYLSDSRFATVVWNKER